MAFNLVKMIRMMDNWLTKQKKASQMNLKNWLTMNSLRALKGL